METFVPDWTTLTDWVSLRGVFTAGVVWIIGLGLKWLKNFATRKVKKSSERQSQEIRRYLKQARESQLARDVLVHDGLSSKIDARINEVIAFGMLALSVYAEGAMWTSLLGTLSLLFFFAGVVSDIKRSRIATALRATAVMDSIASEVAEEVDLEDFESNQNDEPRQNPK